MVFIGDQKYGTRGRGKQISLWAYKLSFLHPVTKEEMMFISLPEKVRFVDYIRRHSKWLFIIDLQNLFEVFFIFSSI